MMASIQQQTTVVRPLGVLPLADGTYAVASSDPAKPPYHVTPDGATLRCTCPSYVYSKDDPARCKHADAVRAHRNAQYAAADRYCVSCGLTPVINGMLRCPDCAQRESVPTASRQIEVVSLEERELVFDYERERERIAASNDRIAAMFGFGDEDRAVATARADAAFDARRITAPREPAREALL